jgi:hypothetical protein
MPGRTFLMVIMIPPSALNAKFYYLRSWNLDPQTKLELRQKGVVKNYGTGGILLTAAMPLDEILIMKQCWLQELLLKVR